MVQCTKPCTLPQPAREADSSTHSRGPQPACFPIGPWRIWLPAFNWESEPTRRMYRGIPRMMDTKLSESRVKRCGLNIWAEAFKKGYVEWGRKHCQAFIFPSSLLETGVTPGCRGKAGRHEKMETHFILKTVFPFRWFGLTEIESLCPRAFFCSSLTKYSSSYNLCSSASKNWAPGK